MPALFAAELILASPVAISPNMEVTVAEPDFRLAVLLAVAVLGAFTSVYRAPVTGDVEYATQPVRYAAINTAHNNPSQSV